MKFTFAGFGGGGGGNAKAYARSFVEADLVAGILTMLKQVGMLAPDLLAASDRSAGLANPLRRAVRGRKR